MVVVDSASTATSDIGDNRTTGPSNTAKGVVSLLAGVVLVPVGMGVNISNSYPKCERDPGDIFGGGAGICSESGPSKSGHVIGTGLALSGLYFTGLGLYYLTK
jgi:hypothetical protein